MLNSNPQIADIQCLDGRVASTLSPMETAVLNFYHAKGRKYGISMTIINRADPIKVAKDNLEMSLVGVPRDQSLINTQTFDGAN